MKKTIFIVASCALLFACTTAQIRRTCDATLSGASTAQELIPILKRNFGLSEAKATSWAVSIFAGQTTVGAFCALVPPPPVAVAGT